MFSLAPIYAETPDAVTVGVDEANAGSREIATVFNRLFGDSFMTHLCGGADEPLYLPASDGNRYHQVHFRADYAASALHEAAHWCIAGEARRCQIDYGYWYEPDGRDAVQQRHFEQLEARPQALEWLFSRAAGLPFKVSIDNLDGRSARGDFSFQLGVWQALQSYIRWGLPDRARAFRCALAAQFGGPQYMVGSDYTLGQLV